MAFSYSAPQQQLLSMGRAISPTGHTLQDPNAGGRFGLSAGQGLSSSRVIPGMQDRLLETLLMSGGRGGFSYSGPSQQDILNNISKLTGAAFGGGSGSGSSSSGGAGDGYKELSDRLQGQIGSLGGSQREAINRQYDNSLNSSLSRLSDRGFGNSSLVESTQGANERNRQSSLLGLEDALLGQRIGVQRDVELQGLNAANQRNNMQFQFVNSLLGGLFS